MNLITRSENIHVLEVPMISDEKRNLVDVKEKLCSPTFYTNPELLSLKHNTWKRNDYVFQSTFTPSQTRLQLCFATCLKYLRTKNFNPECFFLPYMYVYNVVLFFSF